MRIDEIMMRDWVYDSERTQIPMKIEGIFDDGRVCLYEGNYAYAWVDDIRPIPMTEEIAAKNGWERDHEGGYMSRYKKKVDENYIRLFFVKDGRYDAAIHVSIHVFDDMFCKDCRYVHELQQALRRKKLFDLANEIKV